MTPAGHGRSGALDAASILSHRQDKPLVALTPEAPTSQAPSQRHSPRMWRRSNRLQVGGSLPRPSASIGPGLIARAAARPRDRAAYGVSSHAGDGPCRGPASTSNLTFEPGDRGELGSSSARPLACGRPARRLFSHPAWARPVQRGGAAGEDKVERADSWRPRAPALTRTAAGLSSHVSAPAIPPPMPCDGAAGGA